MLVSTAMILILTMKDSLFMNFGTSAEWLYIATVVCVCIIMARELIISAFRQIAAANGVIMAADKLGKFKTIFQDIAIFVLIFAGGWVNQSSNLDKFLAVIGFGLFAVATILTIVSGISYVAKNKKVLKDS